MKATLTQGRLVAALLVVACAAACGSCGGRAPAGAARSGSAPAAPRQLEVPSREMRGEGFELLIPEDMPEVQQHGTFYQTVGSAAQIGPDFAELTDVEVGFSVYQSPEAEFQRRATVREWAEHPLPSHSVFRRATLVAPRVQTVEIPRSAEAALSISEHAGVDQLGTGGHKSLSLRLFIKPAQGAGGWVISAYADGPATHEQLSADSSLSRVLESSLRSFRMTAAPDALNKKKR